MRSVAAIVDPTGVPARIAIRIPAAVPNAPMTAEKIETLLKSKNICIAVTAGKITNAEIKREPTSSIARTTVTAMIPARKLQSRNPRASCFSKFFIKGNPENLPVIHQINHHHDSRKQSTDHNLPGSQRKN